MNSSHTTKQERGRKMYRKKGRKSKKPNKAIFEGLYYHSQSTINEIAEFYNVSIHTIYKWASEFRKEDENKIKYDAQKTVSKMLNERI